MPTIQQLSDEYERLNHDYMDALHTEEMARLKALPASDGDTINAWLAACKAAEQLNDRRVAARLELQRAKNPGLYFLGQTARFSQQSLIRVFDFLCGLFVGLSGIEEMLSVLLMRTQLVADSPSPSFIIYAATDAKASCVTCDLCLFSASLSANANCAFLER